MTLPQHPVATRAQQFGLILLTAGLLVILSMRAAAQESEASLFMRTTAMTVNGIDYYNVDGIEISTQQLRSSFHKNTIRGHFTAFQIGSHNLNESDSTLGMPNYVVSVDIKKNSGHFGNSTTFFIKTSDTSVRAIRFVSHFHADREFQRQFVSIILGGGVPAANFTDLDADSFDFAGRRIASGRGCGWMSLNNRQCPSYGQINWSLHKSLRDAEETAQQQYREVIVANKVKPISEDTVAILFEGVPVRAQRVVFSVKGLNGLITRSMGAKTLTTYYVAAEVRGRYVHSVLSHWNTATLGESGFPLLLEQVMRPAVK